MKKVKENVTQNNLSESEAADEIYVFDEQSWSCNRAVKEWVEVEAGTT